MEKVIQILVLNLKEINIIYLNPDFDVFFKVPQWVLEFQSSLVIPAGRTIE